MAGSVKKIDLGEDPPLKFQWDFAPQVIFFLSSRRDVAGVWGVFVGRGERGCRSSCEGVWCWRGVSGVGVRELREERRG